MLTKAYIQKYGENTEKRLEKKGIHIKAQTL